MFSLTNLSAIYASDQLSKTIEAINKSISKISTGKKIVTAEDAPGIIGYLEKLKAQKTGWERAKENIDEARDLLYTADVALTGVNGILDILQRMRELSLEAANNSTLTSSDLQSIQREIEAMIEEIDRIALSTEYNTKKLLDGSLAGTITASSPYIKGYAIGEVKTAQYEFTARAATRAVVVTNYPLPDEQKMPLSFDDAYDATKDLGEAVFSPVNTAATFNADYDIIFTPGNPDYDFIVYRSSTGETVGTGKFGETFSDPDNPGASITIYSGTQTIQEGYKGIWHADTNPSNNTAQEGNRVVTGTVTLGDLSDRAILSGTLYIEFDIVNGKISYRVTDDEGNPLGAWVSVGATFYAYPDSKLEGSYFTLNVNSVRPGYTVLAGKGDKWKFTFKEYEGLTSSGSLLIEIGTSSYTLAWQSDETLEKLKNDLTALIGDEVTVSFSASGTRERLVLVSKEPGSAHTPFIRDADGNLAFIMGFNVVSGTGTDAFLTINGKTYGPQSSNIFLGAIPNVMLVLDERLQDETGIISVVDKSQTVKAAYKSGEKLNIKFFIPAVNSTTLGLRDDKGNITIDVTTTKGAERAIVIIDNAIKNLSEVTATLGSFEERLGKASDVAEALSYAAQKALSTVRDLDIAAELVRLTTLELKRDLAAAMLAHANLQPERIFQLLTGIEKT